MMDTFVEDRETLNEFLEEADLQQYFELFRDILKVNKLSQLKFVAVEDLSQIGLSKPEQRRYKKIYSKYFPNPYISKIKKLLTSNKRNDGQSTIPVALDLPFSENNVKVPSKHIISIEDITINKELGMGQFGVVQQGTWTTGNQRLQVAIKCLGHERMTSNSTEFLKEAAVMHSIEHPNIVRLYGVVLHLDSLMLVTELAPLRSLLECLREVSLRPNFPVPNLCEFAEQICDGMTYLEMKRLIHRDLAARNILVFSKDRVKISDFGLSRALGVGKDYYQTNYNVNLKLPVAWCAPECILFLRFTSSSDVWAFAVCLWEMFTYGFQPWAAFSGQQILEAIDAPNFQRLERPECCPEAYYSTMLECWSQDPNDRPKFKDLATKLRSIRPEQVQATVNFHKPEESRRNNLLEYKNGQIITILGKESMTNAPLWYGVLPGGACGMFDPNHTKPHIPDPPRQVVTPYKPSEDLEQVPLINPNSPSHLTGASGTTPYPMLASTQTDRREDEVDLACDTRTKSLKKSSHRSMSEPTTSRSILNKVKSATLGRSHKADNGTAQKTDDVHEYQEISDMDVTETNVRTLNRMPSRSENSEGVPKGSTDFSQSLLDEMESMFRNYETRRRDENSPHSRPVDTNTGSRSHTLSKMEKKKASGSMKPMSAHDERTLNTAVALANEITSKSMNDLGGAQKKHPQSPSERTKFHFKFPLSLHHTTHTHEPEREKDTAGKQERRNFSEEANSVPDIQSTITAESKLAYTSLIEEPTPSTSLISHLKDSTVLKPSTIPKPARSTGHVQFHSLQKNLPYISRLPSTSHTDARVEEFQNYAENVLPLPPRTNKAKLIDKPRHIRKYPLRLPGTIKPVAPVDSSAQIIYQNTKAGKLAEAAGVDEFDGVDVIKVDTNPFTSASGPSSEPGPSTAANPFNCFFSDDDVEIDIVVDSGDSEDDAILALVKDCKDHVSVEDLLEFADQKPCGRQRGVESDEVRIMCKVLKQQATPEECLQALEISEWNVHNAIKLLRVKVAVARVLTLEECRDELERANGDIFKASAALVMNKKT